MSKFMSRSLSSLVLGIIAAALGTGCAAKPDVPLQQLAFSGEYGRAREHAARNIFVPKKGTAELSDRQYILSRMRFALTAMADGYCSDDAVFTEVYDRLVQQGINDKSKAGQFFLVEDIKQWKGEPFEQAIMLAYLSMYYGSQGSWDNARAAAASTQFRLKEFKKDGKKLSNEELVQVAAEAEKSSKDDYFENENNYAVRDNDFCLGILLDAIANQQIGRDDEAAAKLKAVAALRPDLEPLTAELAKGDYDRILVVSWGVGPQKIATGHDGVIAAWKQIMGSSDHQLLVTAGGTARKAYPVVCDVNSMSQDHAWNSFQDMRRAKSVIGSVLVGAGAGVTAYGAHRRDSGTAIVGIGMMAVGALAKASARADTRYCDVMPQRFYLVPVKAGKASTVALEVDGFPATHMTLAGIAPPKNGEKANLSYVNLITSTKEAPQWATSGKIFYNNDSRPTTVERPWPYILGGDCVRKPSQAALDYYHKSGYLKDMTVEELQQLYRNEGIEIDGPTVLRTRHVLEGGRSLESPLPGTAGFARLFGQRHPSYVAKSPVVRQLAQRMTAPATPAVAVANR